MTTTDMPNKIHHGRNIKRFREMLDMKQEALAIELGGDWTQRRVSLLEQKEIVEPEILAEIAKALKVPVEAIKNFNEEAAIVNIQANYEGSNTHAANVIAGTGNYHNCTFNPMDKYVEAIEENKKLYEALLKSEREKIALLEKILSDKK
ncbi:helix-turn-helix transcriptional regulator [Paraflavitalea speifideaquila]|uniref:helix-turn-helix transcriptional regulator n=1 Tax=Paraflavitalea speifideaquila TaxID=3076558 RepID=UPI0028E36262|nr:helix-turn-helix transcriptional regulator [Paraflavitalea speifideiaquila]